MEAAIVPRARPSWSLQPLTLPHAERRIIHYSSLQKILLVGEGDFSFSNSLATAFGDGRNIMATSLDSQEKVLKKYAEAAAFTLSNLKRLGASLFHQVDATCMAGKSLFSNLFFDCIVYNFPHAGFHGAEDDKKMIKEHKQLVRLFFENAAKLLKFNGEVHVSHKVSPPYTKWKLEKQAAKSGLTLKEAVDFNQANYPGYTNRRGDGADSGSSFHLGKCKTFIFKISPAQFNPWRELPHMLGRRPVDFFEKIIACRKPVEVPSVLPNGALRVPLNMHGRGQHVCVARASLKRRKEEEWEMVEKLQAAKRGCFGLISVRDHFRQIAIPQRAQLDLIPCERRMMAPPIPSGPFLRPCQGGMLTMPPLPLHPPPHPRPLLPLFR